jgi:hypothetical protein
LVSINECDVLNFPELKGQFALSAVWWTFPWRRWFCFWCVVEGRVWSLELGFLCKYIFYFLLCRCSKSSNLHKLQH